MIVISEIISISEVILIIEVKMIIEMIFIIQLISIIKGSRHVGTISMKPLGCTLTGPICGTIVAGL